MLSQIDLSRADLNLLLLFEEVMAARNVARAAERLNLTPSAISHRLGRLRQLLNDPLFLRTPRGVVPTDRAQALAPVIADILAQVRGVVASAEPFDPATSRRRFTVGAPDAVAELMVRRLLAHVGRIAPGVDLALRQTMLQGRVTGRFARAWEGTLPDLERREMDVAVIPLPEVPARFHARIAYEEDFVAVCRAGHPFAASPDLEGFCAARQLIVSQSGHARGFVDEALERLGRGRRVALAVPNFAMALELLAETDLIAALPRHLAARRAGRHGLAVSELPFPVERSPIRVIVPEAALMDPGIAWLFDVICEVLAA